MDLDWSSQQLIVLIVFFLVGDKARADTILEIWDDFHRLSMVSVLFADDFDL